jgi:tetratricopeptide (TPR) repeat protein
LPEARECLSIALAASPDDTFTLVFLGQTSMWSGAYEEGYDFFARAVSIDRANLWANLFAPTAPLYSGDLQKAAQQISSGLQVLPGDSMLIGCEALLSAKRGDKRKSLQMARTALRDNKSLSHTHHMQHIVSATYAVLEQSDTALKLLRTAGGNGLPLYPGFRDDPHFNSLHNDPRFLQFMSSLKREWSTYQREFGSPVL